MNSTFDEHIKYIKTILFNIFNEYGKDIETVKFYNKVLLFSNLCFFVLAIPQLLTLLKELWSSIKNFMIVVLFLWPFAYFNAYHFNNKNHDEAYDRSNNFVLTVLILQLLTCFLQRLNSNLPVVIQYVVVFPVKVLLGCFAIRALIRLHNEYTPEKHDEVGQYANVVIFCHVAQYLYSCLPVSWKNTDDKYFT